VVLDPPKVPTVKSLQLDCGRARARVETFEAKLEQAQGEFAKVTAESVNDETIDAVAVANTITQASEKVRALEAALKVAMQRQQATEVALKHAGERVQRDALRVKLTKLLDTARAVDAWLDSGKPVVDAYHDARKDVLDDGYRDIATIINVANLSFQTYLFRTCAPMANCNTGYSAFQTDPRWSNPWSMTNPQPDLADTVKLT
jgi:hypothetical protein